MEYLEWGKSREFPRQELFDVMDPFNCTHFWKMYWFGKWKMCVLGNYISWRPYSNPFLELSLFLRILAESVLEESKWDHMYDVWKNTRENRMIIFGTKASEDLRKILGMSERAVGVLQEMWRFQTTKRCQKRPWRNLIEQWKPIVTLRHDAGRFVGAVARPVGSPCTALQLCTPVQSTSQVK